MGGGAGESAPAIYAKDGHTFLRITARPNARESSARLEEGRVVVHVRAPPRDGAANKEILELFSELLDAPRGLLSVEAGGAGREKLLRVDGQAGRSPGALRRALGEL